MGGPGSGQSQKGQEETFTEISERTEASVPVTQALPGGRVENGVLRPATHRQGLSGAQQLLDKEMLQEKLDVQLFLWKIFRSELTLDMVNQNTNRLSHI